MVGLVTQQSILIRACFEIVIIGFAMYTRRQLKQIAVPMKKGGLEHGSVTRLHHVHSGATKQLPKPIKKVGAC